VSCKRCSEEMLDLKARMDSAEKRLLLQSQELCELRALLRARCVKEPDGLKLLQYLPGAGSSTACMTHRDLQRFSGDVVEREAATTHEDCELVLAQHLAEIEASMVVGFNDHCSKATQEFVAQMKQIAADASQELHESCERIRQDSAVKLNSGARMVTGLEAEFSFDAPRVAEEDSPEHHMSCTAASSLQLKAHNLVSSACSSSIGCQCRDDGAALCRMDSETPPWWVLDIEKSNTILSGFARADKSEIADEGVPILQDESLHGGLPMGKPCRWSAICKTIPSLSHERLTSNDGVAQVASGTIELLESPRVNACRSETRQYI